MTIASRSSAGIVTNKTFQWVKYFIAGGWNWNEMFLTQKLPWTKPKF